MDIRDIMVMGRDGPSPVADALELPPTVMGRDMNPNGVTEPNSGRRDIPSLDNPWLIIGLLFCVTGALGIPAIWLSRSFSRSAKVVLTVAVSLYTLAFVWGFWVVMAWSYHRIMDAF